jgi:hypothetical protein
VHKPDNPTIIVGLAQMLPLIPTWSVGLCGQGTRLT